MRLTCSPMWSNFGREDFSEKCRHLNLVRVHVSRMQNSNTDRLVGCFENVFPGLSRSAILAATHDSVADWDSVAQVTLLSLIGEDFGEDFDFEEFEGANSFAAILEVVSSRVSQ